MKKQQNDRFMKLNELLISYTSHVFILVYNVKSLIIKSYFSFIDTNDPVIRLMRLDKPAPCLLIVLPTWWIIAMTAGNPLSFLFFCLFFLLGAVLMRSAGCIINDIFDRKIDAQVERTKNRPLASKELSIKQALLLLFVLLLFAAILLLMLPKSVIYIGIFTLIPVILYPLMKRITYLAQLFLGLTFNLGVFIAWATLKNGIGWAPILVYIAAAIWTLGYDTIYAYQDIKYDLELNLKSTAIKFREKGPKFIWYAYQITIALLCIAGLHMHLNFFFYTAMAAAAYHLYWQIENLDISKVDDCTKKFKSNVEFAFLVLIAILIGRI